MPAVRPLTVRWWDPVPPSPVAGGTLGEVAPSHVVDLRRAVLRDGRLDLPAAYPTDDEPSSLHLGVRSQDGPVVGCVTVLADPLPGRASLHLVLMAVDPGWQGRGVGRALVGTVQDVASAAGLDVWAAARTTALAFYGALGFRPLGDGFDGAMGLPHRRVLWHHRHATTGGVTR